MKLEARGDDIIATLSADTVGRFMAAMMKDAEAEKVLTLGVIKALTEMTEEQRAVFMAAVMTGMAICK